MKRTLTTLAVLLLIAAVSPLFAQQDDTPAPPQQADPPASEETTPAEATDETVDETEDAAERLEELQEAVEDVEVEIVQLQAQQGAVRVQRAVVVQGNVQFAGGFGGGPAIRQFSAELSGLDELVLGAVTDGVTTDSNPTGYRFEAEGPGLLTVAVRAKQGDDMTIEIYDARGTQLGRCDIDFAGDTGAEHLAVPIAEAGEYRVVVDPLGNGGPYWVGASWLALAELEAMAPTRPEDPTQVTPGEPQDIAFAEDGPAEHWLIYTAPAEGLLVLSTTADRGNLVLEAYQDGRFDQSYQASDQDRGGNGARERLLLDLAEGQVVFIKARAYNGNPDLAFTVRSQFIGGEE